MELVFALDQSRSVTEPEFARMKAMLSSLLSGLRVREDHCPTGARVAVLAYDSHARLLIRFSDTYRKDRLLREIEALPYERSTASRDIGKAMRFVSRHVFKRMLPGSHARRIATFFSGGPSVDPQTVTTAGLEFSALDIIPVVIAFNQVPAVRRSFAVRRATCLRSLLCLSARVQGHLQESVELGKVFVTMYQEHAKPLIPTFLFSSHKQCVSSVCEMGITVIPTV